MRCILEGAQSCLGSRRKYTSDSFAFRWLDFHPPVTQNQAGVGKPRLSADFGGLPQPELITVFVEEPTDKRKTFFSLCQLSLPVFLNFDNLTM